MMLLTRTSIAALALFVATPAFAQPKKGNAAKAGGPPPAGAKVAPPSEAVTPAILDAVGAELERAMQNLRIPGAPAPYFIGYKLTEVDVHDAVASLGSITHDDERNFVSIEAHVHVGSYQEDNSNFVASGREALDGIASSGLALEASADRARRSAWLATDAAYKEALAQWRAKKEALAAGASADTGASYTKAPPVVVEEMPKVPALESKEALAERAKAVSAAFRKHGHVRDSRVAFTSFLERRWYLNSEGTNAADTRRVEGILMVATAQADDGQEVVTYFSRYGYQRSELPTDAQLAAEVDKMAGKLAELQKAPLVSNYTGPVLFEGDAAVDIARYTLAPHLSGTPPPVGVASNDALLAGKLVGRVGLKVISDLLSVVDDPVNFKQNKSYVIGSYRFDDEGVAPKRVQVIQNGRLKELLMSRTPSKDQSESNGHARLNMPGGVFRGSATNLVLSGRGGKSQAQMRKALLAAAKAQGLDYGIVIEQLDDVAISSNTELSRLALVQVLQSMNLQAPPQATLAYRLHKDGRMELVRGAQLEPVDMRAWKDLVAVGNKPTVKNFLASSENPFFERLTGAGTGAVPSAGIESSITTPDLLFQELDLRASLYGLRPPPLLPAP